MPEQPVRKRSHVGEWCAYRTPAMEHSHTAAYFLIVEEHPTLPMIRVTRTVEFKKQSIGLDHCDLRAPRWMMERYATDYDKDEETLRKRTRHTLKAEANQHQESGGHAEIHSTETAVASRSPELPMQRVSKKGSRRSPRKGKGGSAAR